MFCRLVATFLFSLFLMVPAIAGEPSRQDDLISFDLSAEEWVTTKNARVVLNVEAAVNESNAGTLRAEMSKSIDSIAKADWRLTGFNRSQDQTGMERWSVVFEARLPEAALNGLSNGAKKASKAGMQIKVGAIDFSPSQEELESARAALRLRIVKNASEQLTSLNAVLPGRQYRIAEIVFSAGLIPPMSARMYRNKGMMGEMAVASAGTFAEDRAQEISQKLTQNARIVFAASVLTAPGAAR